MFTHLNYLLRLLLAEMTLQKFIEHLASFQTKIQAYTHEPTVRSRLNRHFSLCLPVYDFEQPALAPASLRSFPFMWPFMSNLCRSKL